MACPIGTLQYFLIVAKIPFLLIGLIVAIGVLFGKLLCFYMCPSGFAQDLAFRISKRCITIPRWMDWGKYISLIVLVFLLTIIYHQSVFCKICPAGTLEAGIPIVGRALIFEPVIRGPLGEFQNPVLAMVGIWFWLKVAILLAFFIAAIFIRRPFCRIMCPLGALFIIFSKLSHKKMTRKCGGCCN